MTNPNNNDKGWATCRRLFRSADFVWLWGGQAISQIGDGLNKVALLWFVYELTGSALKMTVIGLLQTIPPLLLGPVIGVYLDKLPKRATMIVLDLARVVLLLLIPILFLLNALSLSALYFLVFLIALTSTAFGPALNSAVPLLVPRRDLTAANAVMQSSTTFGMLFGPAISGVGIAFFGAQNVLYANAATFLVSALCKLPIHLHGEKRSTGSATTFGAFSKDLRAGLRFVFVQQRMTMYLLVLVALYNLGSTGFVFLLPVIAKEVLQVGASQLGFIWSALGLGMLLTSAWLAWNNQQTLCNRVWLICGSAIIQGIAILSMRVVASPWVAAFWVLIIGAGAAVVMPVVAASVQEMTPKEMMARVFSILNTGAMSAAMLGMVVFGWAADHVGASNTLWACGIMQLATAVSGVVLIRLCNVRMRSLKAMQPAHRTAR